MILFTSYLRKPLIHLCFLGIFILISGCQSIDVRGQFVNDNAIKEINSKKLTQEQIINLIGTPTYVPEYSSNTWYYIQRSLTKRAWFDPKVVEQRIVKISFNNSKQSTEAILLSDLHNENIKIDNQYTKTYGTEKSDVQKFVKNIGRFNKTTDGKKKRKK